MRSSPIRALVEECVMTGIINASETKADMYNAYKEFCQKNSFTPKASNVFSRELKQYIPNLEEGRTYDNGRVWLNVTLAR